MEHVGRHFERDGSRAEEEAVDDDLKQWAIEEGIVQAGKKKGAYWLVGFEKEGQSDETEETDDSEAESAFPMRSVSPSLGLPQYLLQDFIAFVGDALIERAGARAWPESTLARHPQDIIEQRVYALLTDYMTELHGSMEDDFDQLNIVDGTQKLIASSATSLVRRYRPMLATYFCENAASAPVSSTSMTLRLQELGIRASLGENLGLLRRKVVAAKDANFDSRAARIVTGEWDDYTKFDESDYIGNLTPILDFLVSGKAFQNLAVGLRRRLYYDEHTGMDQIRRPLMQTLCEAPAADRTIISNIGSNDLSYEARFYVTWGVEEFLHSQYGQKVPQVGSLVALTGSALRAQATTCEEYMRATWPNTGLFFLSTLQSLLEWSSSFRYHEYVTCK